MATAYSTFYQHNNIINNRHHSASFSHNDRGLRNLHTLLFDTPKDIHEPTTNKSPGSFIKNIQRANTTPERCIRNIQRSNVNKTTREDIQRPTTNKSPEPFIKNIQRSNTSPAGLIINKNHPAQQTPRKRLQRQGVSFDTGKQQYNKYLESIERRQAVLTSTPRLRKSSSVLRDIIIESISENAQQNNLENMGENNQDIMVKNNNTNAYKNGSVILKEGDKTDGTETPQKDYVRGPKKVYKHRKHHSDYGIVFSIDDQLNTEDEIESDENEANNRTRTVSYSSDHDDVIDGNLSVTGGANTRLHSKSDSNIDESGMFSRTNNCRSPKSNSHVDITSTKMYKDIYADNLRQYGFLFAKQMGLSPDQLRRTYQKSRQRVLERRERSNTSVGDASHRERTDSLLVRERSSTTLSDYAAPPSRKLSSSSTSSLTDITNIGILEKHKKPTTTVIRRKKGNKLPRDPTKRLSAPLMDSLKLPTKNDHSVASLRKQLASMSVPDLTHYAKRSDPCVEQQSLQPTSATSSPTHRKLSDESSKRLQEARARQEWRMSRLKSFEGVLSQANTWMRDVKTKHHDENSTKESQPIKEDAPSNAPISSDHSDI